MSRGSRKATVYTPELATVIGNETGMHYKKVRRVLQLACDQIVYSLAEGKSVQLSGFGRFDFVLTGRGPQRAMRIKFRPTREARRLVNELHDRNSDDDNEHDDK